MQPFLNLGPASIPSYPFLALLGFWAAMWLGSKEAERRGFDGDHLYNIGLYVFLAALLGGRFWYVITHWDSYADAPLQAFALTINAIAVPEAVLFGAIAAVVYVYRAKLNLGEVLDAAAPGIALGLAIGGIGAFLGSQRLGEITAMPWAISQFGEARHPAHLYVLATSLAILGVLWALRKKSRWPGFLFALLIALAAVSRLMLEPFFALPDTIGDGYRTVQVAALVILVIALAVMAYFDTRRKR